MATEEDWLDELLPIRRLMIDGDIQRNALHLNFGSGFTTALDADTDVMSVSIDLATSLADGLMSAADKDKLDGYPTNSSTGIADNTETTANSTLVERDESSRSGFLEVWTRYVKRLSAGVLTIDGKDGVTITDDGNNVATFTRPSVANALIESEQRTLTIASPDASGDVCVSAEGSAICTLSRPSAGNGLLNFGMAATRLWNGNNSGTLTIEATGTGGAVSIVGESGAVLGTLTRPSSNNAKLASGQATFTLENAIASGKWVIACEASICEITRPSADNGLIDLMQQTTKFRNALSAGGITYASTSSTGQVVMDSQVFNQRSRDGFYDYAYHLQRITSLVTPSSTPPSTGRYEQQDSNGSTFRGQEIHLTASGMYEEVTYRGDIDLTRQAILRRTVYYLADTDGSHTLMSIPTADLGSAYNATVIVHWRARNSTDTTHAGGSFSAIVTRDGGGTTIEAQAAFGAAVNGTDSISAIPTLVVVTHDLEVQATITPANTDDTHFDVNVEVQFAEYPA